MEMLHDHADFGPQFLFLIPWGPIFAFLTSKSIYFLQLYKISHRLMGHMTSFIFEPPSAQPRDPVIPKKFGLRTLSIKLQSVLSF
jgi:hypothetical protein